MMDFSPFKPICVSETFNYCYCGLHLQPYLFAAFILLGLSFGFSPPPPLQMFSPPVGGGKTRPTTLGSSQFSASGRTSSLTQNPLMGWYFSLFHGMWFSFLLSDTCVSAAHMWCLKLKISTWNYCGDCSCKEVEQRWQCNPGVFQQRCKKNSECQFLDGVSWKKRMGFF